MAQQRVIKGLAVSPGLAFGPVQVVQAGRGRIPQWSVPEEQVEQEIARLREAVAVAREEFRARQAIVEREAGARDAEIFAVHRAVLADPGAVAQIEGTLRDERVNAESALQTFIDRLERTLDERLKGGIARSYAADITDPWRGVLDSLMRTGREVMLGSGDPIVLAAEELTAKVVTMVAKSRLLAVICTTGARYSHGGVLARAYGVPCVVGLPNLLGRLEQGMVVTVDGARGQVQLRPDDEDVERFEGLIRQGEERARTLVSQANQPAETLDGERLSLLVNIESVRDLDSFDPRHTDGVGLLRTEFLYMERPQFPSEEEQFRLYRRAFEHMGTLPVVLRTLDIGADKQLPYFATPTEPNPALGWRGVRLMLAWQDLLRVQLRAMLRAGAGRDLRILLPMVTTLEEIDRLREVFRDVRNELVDQGYEISSDIPVGVMVEVPSLIFDIAKVVQLVDFVSVGTNDLVQYLLAVDRDNPRVAHYYQPEHPAVIHALRLVAESASAAGIPCSVCGDMADDPATALLLLGLGFDAVSVAPHFVPEIKFAVRRSRGEDVGALAAEALQAERPADVRRLLEGTRLKLGLTV